MIINFHYNDQVLADKIYYSTPLLVPSVQLLGRGVGFFGVEMKICSKCQKPKTLDSFYKDERGKDGLFARCKLCHNKVCKKWMVNNKDYYRKWEASYQRKKRIVSPEIMRARSAVGKAVLRGHLSKHPCYICDDPKAEAHHESYLREHRLDVIWLCIKHHSERHNELNLIQKEGTSCQKK